MTHTPRLFLGALLVALTAPGAADAAELKMIGKPKVGFDAEGPAGLDIDGSASSLVVKDDGTKITFTVEMAAIDTGIDLRNRHMCEKFFDCPQFPTVVLVIDKAALVLPTTEQKETKLTVPGTFTCHGVEQPTTIDLTITPAKQGYTVEGRFPFNTTKHGVEIPNYLGVTVYPDIQGWAKFTLVDV